MKDDSEEPTVFVKKTMHEWLSILDTWLHWGTEVESTPEYRLGHDHGYAKGEQQGFEDGLLHQEGCHCTCEFCAECEYAW